MPGRVSRALVVLASRLGIVADWLLEQGHPEEAIDEALEAFVADAPDRAGWDAGPSFVARLWHRAPPRTKPAVRSVIALKIDGAQRDRREALSAVTSWLDDARRKQPASDAGS